MKRRILSLLLCLCMVMSLLPGFAITAGAEAHDHTAESEKAITMGTSYICIGGEQQTSNTLTSDTYYLDDNVSLGYNTLTIAADATVTLCLNGKTLSTSNSSSSGGTIKVEANATLTVEDCGGTTGVIQNTYSSGIGIYNAGTLTVSSGSVTSGGHALSNASGSTATMDGGSIISTGDSAIYNVGALTVNGGEISCTYSYGGYAVENSGGTVSITNGTLSSTNKNAIYNESGAKLYLSGSPTLTPKAGEAQIYFYYAPKLYPYTGSDESKAYYSGTPISIGLYSYSAGTPVVLENGTVGADKFTLMDSGYVLAQGTGDNEANLVIKAVERTLTWQDKDGQPLSGDSYPAKADHNAVIGSIPALPAVDNLTAAGWLYSTDGGSSWSTDVWTTTDKVAANTTFKALYAPAFAGGDGSEQSPYQIANIKQLTGLATLVNAEITGYVTAYYQLTADVAITGAWTPIGGNYTPFRGHFDGNGKTVTFDAGATLNAEYAGVFGVVGKTGASATVENLLVAGSINNGNGGTVGGVAGALRNGSITDCAVTAEMTGVGDKIGGIVGGIEPAGACSISRCYSTSDLTGAGHVGGIAGWVNNYGTTFIVKIENCYSTGNIHATGASSNAGGILGIFAGSGRPEGTGIFSCYATGNITEGTFATDSAGGIVGNAGDSRSHSIQNCLYLGIIVDGDSYSRTSMGRIAGNGTYATISGCYGRNDTSLNDYANAEAIGNTEYYVKETGKNGATLTVGGENVTMATAFAAWAENSAWTIPAETAFAGNSALPTLTGALGTQNPTLPENKAPVPDYGISPSTNADYIFPGRTYTIGSAEELSWLGSISSFNNCKDSFFELTADITATQAHYVVPIGSVSVPFCGSFDGKGHTVTPDGYMTLRQGSDYYQHYYLGLFGCVGSDKGSGTIKNVALKGSPISMSKALSSGQNFYLGGLVAYLNYGTVENCASEVDVSFNCTSGSDGECRVGGLVGNMGKNGTVKNCYASGDVSATATSSFKYCRVGGIVGESASTVENCYASGSVKGTTGSTCAGGLVGRYSVNGASTKNSVALGASISNYYSGKGGRIVGPGSASISTDTGEGNFARADLRLGSATTTGTVTDKNGADAAVGESGIAYSSLFTGWDSSIWNITGDTKLAVGASLPTLKVFGSKITAPSLIEYVGPGINVTGDSFASDYGATAEKTFTITLTGGAEGTPTVAWCSQDGTTTGSPASAGSFAAVSGSESAYSVTLTPSASANAGTYYFKATAGDISVVKTFTVNKIAYDGTVSDKTVNVYAGGSGTVTAASLGFTMAGAKIAGTGIQSGDKGGALAENTRLQSSDGTVDYIANSNFEVGKSDKYTFTIKSTNYNNISVIVSFTTAAESRTLYFNGTTLKIGADYNNLTDYPADDTWSIDAANKTLKLNGFDFSTSAATALYISSSCTVELTGTNRFKSTYSGSESSYGVYVYASSGNIYFTGSGTLSATGGTNTGTLSSYGISAECYSLRFEGCEVIAAGSSAPFSYGVNAKSNMYVSEGAKVTGRGTGSNYAYGIAQYTANLHVSDGTLIGEADGTAANKYGIAFSELYRNANTPLHLFGDSGSGYTVAAKQSAEHNYNTSYTVVNAEGETETPFAKAKISTYTRDKALEITANTASVDNTATEGWAWDKENSILTINGLNMNATNHDDGSPGFFMGIALPDGAKLVVLGENSITTNGGAQNTGIFCNGTLTVSGTGSLAITANGGDGMNAALAVGGLTISEATLVLTAGATTGTAAESVSAGIMSTGNVVINSGEVTASGETQGILLMPPGESAPTPTVITEGATIKAGDNATGTDTSYTDQKYVNISFGAASVTIGATTTKYADFATALAAAKGTAGSKLTLLRNVTGSGTIDLGDKDLTLNLGSFTLTGQLKKTGGTLTVTGASGGKVTVGGEYSTVKLTHGASLVLDTVTLEQTNGDQAISTSYTDETPVGGSVTINSGSVTQLAGTRSSNAINAASGFTMTGGTVSGATDTPTVAITGGAGTISNGTITNTGGASALIIGNTATATVSGGTLTGSGANANCYAIKSYGNLVLSGAPTLSGGAATLYTQDGASVSAGGYTGNAVTVFYGDSMQTGTQTAGMQSVGDVVVSSLTDDTQAAKFTLVNPLRTISAALKYDDAAKTLSLASPFGADAAFDMTDPATGAGTITVTGDVTLSDSFEVNTGVTLDLNGHEVTGPDGKPSIVVKDGSTLIVQDSGNGDDKGVLSGGSGQSGVSVENGGSVTVNTGAAVTGGSGAAGITAAGTGAVTVNGSVTGGTGASGIYSTGSGTVSIGSTGSVTGGAGTDNTSSTAGSGGTGVVTGSGNITVGGTITGGVGGDTTSGNGGNGGTGVSTASGIVSGSGTITGGDGGSVINGGSGTPGSGGAAISGGTDSFTGTSASGKKGVKAQLNNTTGAIIEVPTDTLAEGALSDTDRTQTATVTMTIADSDDAAANAAIDTEAGSGKTVGAYFDITISKTVGSGNAQIVTETSELIPITLTLSKEMQGKDGYEVLRRHEGAVDTLTTEPNAAGEYITVNAEKTVITVYAKKFSTYAIAYSDTQITPPAPVGPSDPGTGGAIAAPTPTLVRPVNGKVTINPTNPDVGSTVTINTTPNEGYEVDTVTVSIPGGTEIDVTDFGNGKFTFKQPSQRVTITVTFKPKAAMPFTDVAADAYYYSAVAWAAANGVTGGKTASTFAPYATCTRAQMVTFLWRALGSPEPRSADCPFTDVRADAYYYKAVLWAVEKGVTKGTSGTTFSPNDTVKRAQVVTLQWRAAGSPAAIAVNPFTDVSSDAYYTDAVLWAVEQKITSGATAATFSPAGPCTRAQIVTFLYRYLAK